MATLAQDLDIGLLILENLEAFLGGQPVSKTVPLGKGSLALQAVRISGPDTQYPAITGSVTTILFQVLGDFLEETSGAPVTFAEKVGGTWLGWTLTYTVPA